MTPSNQKVFTDADKERLKEFINGTLDPRGEESWNIRMHKRQFYEALIVRLEAAELALKRIRDDDGICDLCNKFYEAWRKAAGK